MIPSELMDGGYEHTRPRSYDFQTGLPFRRWTPMTDMEVVEDVLNDMQSNDRERDLALRLLNLLEGQPPRFENCGRRHRG